MVYTILLGSNHEAEANMALAVCQLRNMFPEIKFSRQLLTEPIDVDNANMFINMVATFCSEREYNEVRDFFKLLERDAGRNLYDKEKGIIKLDIDILKADGQLFKLADWNRWYVKQLTKEMSMKVLGIIPARYASTRFPAKPLAVLGGKPVIQRVYEQVAGVFDDVYVATDDEIIETAVKAFGGNVVMTSTNHRSGTDRCYEAMVKIGGEYDVVVNIQGDEPFIQKSQLEAVKACFVEDATQIATLVKPFSADTPFSALENINSPKVVVDKDMNALYFSRSIIPFCRNKEKEDWIKSHVYYKHIGLYAYRPDVLKKITSLPQSTLEIAESLEQLRWLENGFKIKVAVTEVETIGIDTPDDLKKAEEFLKTIC